MALSLALLKVEKPIDLEVLIRMMIRA